MKESRIFLVLALFITLFIHTSSSIAQTEWVNISGTVTYNGLPVCAMALANGQYMFTCSGDGSFNLDVPLDSNGMITLYGFCSGKAPFKAVLTPEEASNYNIVMESSFQGSMKMNVTAELAESTSKSGWVSLTGSVMNERGTPLCAMALANGQAMFTCDPMGEYALDVPLDDSGQITLYVFCSGRSPFKAILTADCPDDADLDGICDDEDNCPNTSNPGQEDSDGNGIGNMCQECTTTVIYPNGGEVWEKYTTYTIRWTSNCLIEYVTIRIHGGSDDNQGGWFLVDSHTLNDGSYDFLMPPNWGYNQFKVYIMEPDWNTLDESDDYFFRYLWP